jgi:hypothetical protein
MIISASNGKTGRTLPFAAELRKLSRPVRVVAMHLKARYQAEVATQLRSLGIAELELAQFEMPYVF